MSDHHADGGDGGAADYEEFNFGTLSAELAPYFGWTTSETRFYPTRKYREPEYKIIAPAGDEDFFDRVNQALARHTHFDPDSLHQKEDFLCNLALDAYTEDGELVLERNGYQLRLRFNMVVNGTSTVRGDMQITVKSLYSQATDDDRLELESSADTLEHGIDEIIRNGDLAALKEKDPAQYFQIRAMMLELKDQMDKVCAQSLFVTDRQYGHMVDEMVDEQGNKFFVVYTICEDQNMFLTADGRHVTGEDQELELEPIGMVYQPAEGEPRQELSDEEQDFVIKASMERMRHDVIGPLGYQRSPGSKSERSNTYLERSGHAPVMASPDDILCPENGILDDVGRVIKRTGFGRMGVPGGSGPAGAGALAHDHS